MRLSFKKDPKTTGLAGVAEPNPRTVIKGDGVEIGYIRPPHYADADYVWSVMLRVNREPTPSDPCPWRYAELKKKFTSEPDAREYIKAEWETLSKLKIYKKPD